MTDEDSNEATETTGSFSISAHNTADLRDAAEEAGLDYDELTKKQKLKLSRGVDPEKIEEVDNVTCVGLFRGIVRLLDASTPDAPPIDQFALGRGSDSTQVTTNSESLIDEVDRVTVTQYGTQSAGEELICTIFVDEGEANVNVSAGETLDEGGLIIGDEPESGDNWELANHALFSQSYQKDASKTLTMEYTLSFADGGT